MRKWHLSPPRIRSRAQLLLLPRQPANQQNSSRCRIRSSVWNSLSMTPYRSPPCSMFLCCCFFLNRICTAGFSYFSHRNSRKCLFRCEMPYGRHLVNFAVVVLCRALWYIHKPEKHRYPFLGLETECIKLKNIEHETFPPKLSTHIVW